MLHRLTDADLVAVADSLAGDLSYYYSGWDWDSPEGVRRQEGARLHCRHLFAPVAAAMLRRGLSLTRMSLVTLKRY